MNRGMAIIEFLIGFLVLTILVACFLRASLFEEENIRIEQAKQEFSQYKKDTTRAKEVIIDVIEDDDTRFGRRRMRSTVAPRRAAAVGSRTACPSSGISSTVT